MTTPTLKRDENSANQPLTKKPRLATPIVFRRCAAWIIEVSVVGATALVPYGIGAYINAYAVGNRVPLSPVLATTGETISSVFALPSQPPSRVPPLTNLLWWGALVTPLAYGGYQIYLLGKTGQTATKRWFGVKVVDIQGNAPGLKVALVREGVGRWGIPVGSAYLLWRLLGTFPDLTILTALGILALLGDSAYYFFSKGRKTFHGRISNTSVVDAVDIVGVEVSEADESETPQTQVTSIVPIHTLKSNPIHLWRWMVKNPGTTLLLAIATVMIAVLGTFVGTQVYIQKQTNQRDAVQQRNQVFLGLVQQLSSTSSNALEQRRSAILALARLEDPRVAPLLVDLLGQERHPALIETIQQALVGTGPGALPPLRHLNQALSNDLLAFQKAPDKDVEKKLFTLRLRACQRAIAKLMTIHNGRLPNVDLSRTNLSFIDEEVAHFTLVWNNLNLSGVNFRGSVLSNAQLRGSIFYSAGPDGSIGTFDDWIADLSGADLHDADLSGANLSKVSISNTNLIRVNLNRANLSEAVMKRANLSSASLVNANLNKAILTNASLTGSKLGQATLSLANLQGANLGQVSAPGTDFTSANLSGSTWQGANLAEANLQNANLRQANLSSTTLSKANLRNANLQGADLNSTTLTGANLRNTNLQNVNLSSANLTGTDLRGANLTGANFEGVSFTKQDSQQILVAKPGTNSIANINGVNFSKAENITEKQLEFICGNKGIHPGCQ